jgi:hypothetical protein
MCLFRHRITCFMLITVDAAREGRVSVGHPVPTCESRELVETCNWLRGTATATERGNKPLHWFWGFVIGLGAFHSTHRMAQSPVRSGWCGPVFGSELYYRAWVGQVSLELRMHNLLLLCDLSSLFQISLMQVALFNISRHLVVHDWLVILRSRLDMRSGSRHGTGLKVH